MDATPSLAPFDQIDVVRRPLADGDWFIALRNPADLLEPQFAPWREAVVSVSSAAFGTDTSEVWAHRFTGRFFHDLFRWALIFDADNNFIGSGGYRATTIADERLVYWESSSVAPSHRGRGVVFQIQLGSLVLEAKRSGLPVYNVMRTRNPAGFSNFLRRFGTLVAPSLDGSVRPELHALYAAAADWLGFSGCDPTTGRIIGTYAGRPPLYGAGGEPVSSNQDVNELFASLGPEDGLLVFVGPNAHAS